LEFYQVIVLSLVQGLTEFLPVSSSAHLILVPELLGWPDQGLAFDITVHLGTLVAVLVYFRADLKHMISDFFRALCGKGFSMWAKLFWAIAVATIPVGLGGLFLHTIVETHLRSPLVIAGTTLGFGLLLWLADSFGRRNRPLSALNWRDVCVIGCAQAVSLIPGTSRSGITLTAGLGMGLDREAAARFSFLLSIPVIILAGGLESYTLLKSPLVVDWRSLGIGFCVSALSGYFCIHYFIQLISRMGLLPFICYRFGLGFFLWIHFFHM
jgi:undecaprenyl-diphosphatase